MANLYGVANPNPIVAFAGVIGGANVNCPAGVETNVVAIAINPATSPGWYYPFIMTGLDIVLGATAPSIITVSGRIGSGADFAGNQVSTGLLVASATIVFSQAIYGYNTIVSNPFGATTLNVSINPGLQAVTCNNQGTLCWGGWLRAPDQ